MQDKFESIYNCYFFKLDGKATRAYALKSLTTDEAKIELKVARY